MLLVEPFGPNREGFVNVLTRQGAAVLDETTAWLWQPSHTPRRWQPHFAHRLLIAGFGVEVYSAATPPFRAWNFYRDQHLASRPDTHFLTYPDGHFVISNSDTGQHYAHFFEIDRGFTTGSGGINRHDWVEKIRNYGRYLRHGGFELDFPGLAKPVVLIVTNESRRDERALTLLSAIEEAKGRGSYWVATYPEIVTGGLWAKVWRTVGSDERRSLADRCTMTP